jgi:uncharacterized protein (TIGR02453 family)
VAFEGFPREGLDFLAQLGEHNERAWFERHRETYERCLLEPARDLVVELGELLRELDPDVVADPRVNGSIRRINRDTRFSKDKRPYKTHLDLWFAHGGLGSDRPGFWFRLSKQGLILGVGMHRFERELLERYREAVADPERGGELARVEAQLREAGLQLGGRHYKRVPAGFDVPAERADLLRHDGLYVGRELEPVPPETHTPDFPAFCAAEYARFAPLQRWLVGLAFSSTPT